MALPSFLPMTRATLDGLGCCTPGCKESHELDDVYLSAGCHPAAGVDPHYIKAEGVLALDCLECGKRVATVRVAAGADA